MCNKSLREHNKSNLCSYHYMLKSKREDWKKKIKIPTKAEIDKKLTEGIKKMKAEKREKEKGEFELPNL